MKKLALTQIFMGILVVASLVFWTVWLSTGYLYAEGTVPGTDIHVVVHGNPGRATLLDNWVLIYFALGLAVIGCGIAQFVKARHKSAGKGDKLDNGDESRKVKIIKLAIVQIVLGALIVGSLVWFTGWVEWDYGSITVPYEDVEVEVHPLPGWTVQLISWKAVSFVLGLSVLGCGIIQYLRAKRQAPGISSRLESYVESMAVKVGEYE